MAGVDEHRDALEAGAAELAWEQARRLVGLLEGTSVSRLAVEAGAYKIEIERGVNVVSAPPAVGAGDPSSAAPAGQAAGDGAREGEDRGHPVLAPLVGRFFRGPEPGADPFVNEGDVVEATQILCIVEAMKVMNQVTAGQPGRILDVLVQDGEYVEFEQVLMYLEPLDG
jgi:acetyl-CoA carboxylase biotin carboxyl carrier protein